MGSQPHLSSQQSEGADPQENCFKVREGQGGARAASVDFQKTTDLNSVVPFYDNPTGSVDRGRMSSYIQAKLLTLLPVAFCQMEEK